MGVNELWSILEPVRESVPLHSLSGKTLAVDLSLWVCEAQAVRGMMGKVTKPHLRNLFFRVSCLTLMGIKLIFVMEGEAPKLKADTMSKRNAVKYGTSGKATTRPGKTGRSHFKFLLKECAELLDCLGVPWVTAAGEAEAMCAYLNVHGYVDGCITNDGDVFLYGGQTVYRNFNTNTKNLAWDKMEWPKPYTCERVLIMMTYTEMKNKKLAKESTTQIKPVRIFKSRVRNGVPCFEVIWHKPDKKRKPKAQKSANTDDVADLLAQMTIQPSIKETSELGTNAEGEQHLNDSEEQEDDLRTFHCLSVLHNSSITITSKETLCDNPTIVTEAKKTENKETAHSLSPVSSNKQHSLTTSSPALIEELQLSGIDWGATSFGTASKEQHSLTASSPSALIEELQLSGIDWGATSFGTSPSAPVHKTLSATSKQGDSLTPLQSSKDNECTKSLVHSTEKGEELTFCSGTMDHNSLCIDLKEHSSNPAANLPYSQFSLRDRILLKNFNHSSTSQHRNNDVVSVSLKPLKYLTPVEQKNECPAVEKAPLSKPSVVESQNFKGQKSVKEKLTGQKSCSKQVEKHASVKTSTHLVKHEGGEKKQHQKVFQSKTVENQHHVKSTNQSKISSLPLSHKCDVPVNHTLVVAKNIKKSVIKKSVCHNLCSSSEDSDAENTSSIVQKHQAQSKTKQRCVSSSDEKIKTTKMASKLCAKKAFSHIEAPLSSKRYLGQIANSQTQKNEKLLTTNAKPSVEIEKEKQRFPSGVNHCGIANCSQSPVHSSESRDSEGDDSIISLDSPLPLSERIKLRFQN
ncbi:Flap endonuclease GEN-like 1 [Acipenser ruthenus]|uniref:Flap endonuclease GEN-like 1 n=1 Tax=Acipenser ruthenus TaxID=7906 RepID=A0A662YXQ1_ACIRT|nr:Flap endonuclease GEN-like 1 [Acipenser ruthenus]